MGMSVIQLKTKKVSLTQNSWTKLLNASIRRHAAINNNSGNNLRVAAGENPWCVTFASASSQFAHLDIGGNKLLADATLLASTSGSIRFKFRSTAGAAGNIFWWSNAAGTSFLSIYISTSSVTAQLNISGVTQWTLACTSQLVPGQWYDVKLHHSGITPSIFISTREGGVRRDGEKWPATLTGPNPTTWFSSISTPTLAQLGRKVIGGAPSSYLDGSIQYFQIFSGLDSKWNKVNIQELWMNEGSAVSLIDYSGNGYNGVVVNSPLWDSYDNGLTLATGSNEWYDCVNPSVSLWGFTTANGTTCEVQEGR